MEILNVPKFWTTPTQNSINSSSSTSSSTTAFDYSDDEEKDDSFFELDFNSLKNDNIKPHKNHPNIEPTSKPLSPISILKLSPKFRIFMEGFGSPRSRKTEENRAASIENSEYISKDSNFLSIFSKVKSWRSCNSKLQKEGTNVTSSSPIDSPKRVIQRYLKLEKPVSVNASSVMKNGRLGKSRSAAAANRRDDSVLQQNDGIQSAILHCKRCNSSRAGFLISSVDVNK